jgi:hypothetical protein
MTLDFLHYHMTWGSYLIWTFGSGLLYGTCKAVIRVLKEL